MVHVYLPSHPDFILARSALIVTCDHGRGDKIKKQWTSHGQRIEGADEIWFAAIGPHIRGEGELENTAQIYQGQFAATFAAILGFQFKSDHPVMTKIGNGRFD